MKKLIPFIAILIAACSSPDSNSYTIEGKIIGKSPAQAKLIRYDTGEYITVDSVDFTNGEFKFKGSIDLPEMYWVKIGDHRPISFFLENSTINITAYIDSLNKAEIKGSKTQDQYIAYQDSKKQYSDQLEIAYSEYKKAESDEAKTVAEIKYDSIDALQTEYIKEYVRKNGNSILAPYIIRREIGYYLNLEELEELTNVVSPDLKKSKYTQSLLERITTLRSLQPGMLAPEFTQNDNDENPVSLSDFKGQYLLIDFWASWCSPCRQANPTVVKMYNKYKSKGFTILGISMDSDKDKWLEAIEADQLTWSQVSTLTGWKNPVGKIYAVNSIPHAILIGPDGKIIKRGIHANELEELLGGLLK